MNIEMFIYICIRLANRPKFVAKFYAGVVELVDTLDLGSSAARCESSSLSARTKKASQIEKLFLFLAFSILNIKPLYLFQ